ncbi:FUSC family protein [Burkholderia pyrrocinia]
MNSATVSRKNPLRAFVRGHFHLPMAEALRGGMVCAVPAVLAALLREPLLCWSAIAAFWTCLADESTASASQRLLYGLLFGVLGALASGIGIASAEMLWLAIVLTGAVAYAGALGRTRGSAPGLRGLLIAASCSVSAALPVHSLPAAVHYAMSFMGGSIWATVCTVTLWQSSPAVRARRATFAYLDAMSSFLRRLADAASGEPVLAVQGRAGLRAKLDAMNKNMDQTPADAQGVGFPWRSNSEPSIALLAGLESFLAGNCSPTRRESRKWLVTPLRELAMLVDEGADAVRRGSERHITARRQRLMSSIRSAMELANASDVPEEERAWHKAGMTLVMQLADLMCESAGAEGDTDAARLLPSDGTRCGWRSDAASILEQIKSNERVARYALRLAIATMIAGTLARLSRVDQGYWLVLTTMFVVQPTVSQTVKVSSLRLSATILGAVLALVLALLVHNPILLALTIVPLATATFAAREVSYLSYIFFLTPHFILVAHLGTPAGAPLALAVSRVGNSAAGALVGVLVSMIAWPEWERRKLTSAATCAISAATKYLNAILDRDKLERIPTPHAVAAVRREACIAVDELDAVIAAIRLETLSSSHYISYANVLVVHLRRLIGDVSPLECRDNGFVDADRERLAALAGHCTAVIRGLSETELSPNTLGPFVCVSSKQSLSVRHIEQRVMENARVISAMRSNLA